MRPALLTKTFQILNHTKQPQRLPSHSASSTPSNFCSHYYILPRSDQVKKGYSTTPKKDISPKKSSTTENLSPPRFSFEGLGINRNVKIVILVYLAIAGSIETTFWACVLWRWYTSEIEEEDREKGFLRFGWDYFMSLLRKD